MIKREIEGNLGLSFIFTSNGDIHMKRLKDASKTDIQELKLRLNKHKEQRLLDRDLREVINIVNGSNERRK